MFKVKQNYVILGSMLVKEMIDLTVQRDLAQSQVQDLPQLVGDEGHSMTRRITESVVIHHFV
ncbi:hypothetical protein CsSME_00008113 [Camellia sinensis var. sinensis]